eukprot:TRINITY_DN550_c0_g3_i1.p2 TRINITY_DN550_c0_g3~~TRINITY_DN550_c0_g3_i1.p2  ORF type:complete len:109 (+),score=41.04 TRINITY_DN550_c0_g3_i1:238-564(+)
MDHAHLAFVSPSSVSQTKAFLSLSLPLFSFSLSLSSRFFSSLSPLFSLFSPLLSSLLSSHLFFSHFFSSLFFVLPTPTLHTLSQLLTSFWVTTNNSASLSFLFLFSFH